MIDFRYHLVSIVAVFLALGIGILMGSLVLGEALVNQLNNDLERIEDRNDRLRGNVDELRAQLEADQDFVLSARPHLIDNRLAGEEIVLFTFEGVDGAVVEEARTSINDAGGTIVTSVSLRDKFALTSAPERDELALLIASQASSAEELQREVGTRIGSLFTEASAREDSLQDNPSGPATPELDTLVEGLQDAGYIDVDLSGEGSVVPPNASFVILGGSEEEQPFEIRRLAVALADQLAFRAPVLAAESSSSSWGLVDALRDNVETSDTVATVDQAESISGGIAVAMGLDLADEGTVSHYGVRSGADDIIPRPTPAP